MGKLTVRDIEVAISQQRADGTRPRKLTADKGLRLRINRDGTGTWLVLYMLDGKEREYRLPERYGIGAGQCSLAQARERASVIRAKARAGVDYAVEQAEELAARERERQAEEAERMRLANRVTVRAMFELWDTLVLSRRKRPEEVRRGWRKDVLPLIGTRFAEEVTRADIMAVLDPIVGRGSNRFANRLLAEMRQAFGFGLVRDIVSADPTHRIARRDVGGRETERDRVLSEPEIRELAGKLPHANLERRFELAVWVVLGTGCRVGELASAERHLIDIDAGEWVLPDTKNGKPHVVYLSAFVKGYMRGLLALSKSDRWLMPDGESGRHVSPRKLTQLLTERQWGTSSRKRLPSPTNTPHSLELPGGRWTSHDLRRTAATLMGGLGVRPDIIERCLNHTEQNRIVRTYQRQELIAEQTAAWAQLGERLTVLTRNTLAVAA